MTARLLPAKGDRIEILCGHPVNGWWPSTVTSRRRDGSFYHSPDSWGGRRRIEPHETNLWRWPEKENTP